MDWSYGSVAEDLPYVCEALGLLIETLHDPSRTSGSDPQTPLQKKIMTTTQYCQRKGQSGAIASQRRFLDPSIPHLRDQTVALHVGGLPCSLEPHGSLNTTRSSSQAQSLSSPCTPLGVVPEQK